NVPSSNAAATLQVTFTFQVGSGQEPGLVVAYFDPSTSTWVDVNAPGISNGVPATSAETIVQNGNGTDTVSISTTLSSTTTPTISALTGTVFTAAFTPTPVYWSGFAGDGNWDNPGNWSLNAVPQPGDSVLPGPKDAVTIDNRSAPTPFTATHSAG